MSFDTMRRHQRKIQIPLAIIVTIMMVGFIGGAGIDGLFRARRGGSNSGLGNELAFLGQDLRRLGWIRVDEDLWKNAAARIDRDYAAELAAIEDETKREDERNELINREVRSEYQARAAGIYYLPLQVAEQLGVQVGDEDVSARVIDFFKARTGLDTFDNDEYQADLAARNLTDARFQELVRGQLRADRAHRAVNAICAASEAEQYALYCGENQKVRVQYFDRKPGDFVDKVKLLPGDRPKDEDEKADPEKPAEEKAEPAAEKATEDKPAEEKSEVGDEEKVEEKSAEEKAAEEKKAAEDKKKAEEEKQAEEDRIIVRYKTVINWDKAKDEHVWALIEVRITPQRDFGFSAIAERIYQFPETRSVYLVSGAYDLAVMITGKSMHQIADFVAQKLSPIEGVRGTATYFILKRYKEDGEILDNSEESKRQPVIL